jgi:hypothetical protein
MSFSDGELAQWNIQGGWCLRLQVRIQSTPGFVFLIKTLIYYIGDGALQHSVHVYLYLLQAYALSKAHFLSEHF